MMCRRVPEIEALVAGEIAVGQRYELTAHAKTCPMCTHEMRWLETERLLLRKRAGRELFSSLARNQPARIRRGLAWVFSSTSVTVLFFALTMAFPRMAGAAVDGAEVGPAYSEISASLQQSAPCSRIPENVGFQCGAPSDATRQTPFSP